MDEEVLVRQALAGDRDSFAALVEKFKAPVYNLAYRMMGNSIDAEDVAQDAFLRAYTQLATYQPDRKFGTWLLSIAAHLCIDRLRRKRPISLDSLPFFDRPDEVSKGPETAALDREKRDAIQDLLKSLPVKYRAPIVLRYWYDRSYAEIATILGLSESAVKTRLFRARELLARELGRKKEQDSVLSKSW
ncbi:MAG: sigma-70 family RNA polymerase sigma factor [Dehalococcoidia bacterium]|nr:sigma-70 family RNA polymerase sigma factor [Dehalococcoidia bacterium]